MIPPTRIRRPYDTASSSLTCSSNRSGHPGERQATDDTDLEDLPKNNEADQMAKRATSTSLPATEPTALPSLRQGHQTPPTNRLLHPKVVWQLDRLR
mmetsp:Transcript_3633/g.6372  ORF Transcript_3633/g.6372 Transcript_3633/m.6372 type:complete len:97 (-) Transcript_3633:664-954(-)